MDRLADDAEDDLAHERGIGIPGFLTGQLVKLCFSVQGCSELYK
jgi:hypothetical protein